MEFIDDHPVVGYRIRFQAPRPGVEITEADADLVRDDRTIVWLVRARCKPPQYHPVRDDAEERYRLNIQAVVDAVPLSGQAVDQGVSYLDHHGSQGYLDLGVPHFKQEQAFDPDEYGPHVPEYQIAELARYLADLDSLNIEETPVENVRRLVEKLQGNRKAAIGAQRPEPGPLERPVTAPPAEAVPRERVPLPGEVEVVGTVWANGQRPASQDLIDEAFSRP